MPRRPAQHSPLPCRMAKQRQHRCARLLHVSRCLHPSRFHPPPLLCRRTRRARPTCRPQRWQTLAQHPAARPLVPLTSRWLLAIAPLEHSRQRVRQLPAQRPRRLCLPLRARLHRRRTHSALATRIVDCCRRRRCCAMRLLSSPRRCSVRPSPRRRVSLTHRPCHRRRPPSAPGCHCRCRPDWYSRGRCPAARPCRDRRCGHRAARPRERSDWVRPHQGPVATSCPTMPCPQVLPRRCPRWLRGHSLPT